MKINIYRWLLLLESPHMRWRSRVETLEARYNLIFRYSLSTVSMAT